MSNLKQQLIAEPTALTINEQTYFVAPVPETEGKYLATTCGHIISLLKSDKPIVLKPRKRGKGYPAIHLQGRQGYIHRLVAMTFLNIDAGNDTNGKERYQINHINGDIKNNKVCNLEVVSASENILHNQILKVLRHELREREELTV